MFTFVDELVAIPTENPPGRAYPQCVEALAKKLRHLGLEAQILDVPRGPAPDAHGASAPANLFPRQCLRSFYGPGSRTLYFHGHYDVVPAASEAQFSPRVQGANLFGRGSSDMKGGLAAMIYAVHALKECGIPLAGRVGLVMVPDEETGGAQGSAWLSRSGILGTDGIGMLTPEPTGGVIWNASRGAISLRVTVKGKPAHVGLHYLGHNAFEDMLTVAEALRALKKKVEARKTNFEIKPERARNSILMLGGRCEGGTSFNLVPAECSFTVDRRINPEENLPAEKTALLDLFDRPKKHGITIEVELLQEGSAAGVSAGNPVAQVLRASIAAITGKPPKFEMCPGLLEIRYYAEKGIPAFAYGPGLLTVSHGPNEFVPLARIPECAAIYALAAARLLASGGKGQCPRRSSSS